MVAQNNNILDNLIIMIPEWTEVNFQVVKDLQARIEVVIDGTTTCDSDLHKKIFIQRGFYSGQSREHSIFPLPQFWTSYLEEGWW